MEKRLNKNVLPEVSEVDLVFRSKVKASLRPKVTDPDDAYKLLIRTWDKEKLELLEQCKVLLLTLKGGVLGIYEASSGGIDRTIVDARTIFAAALKTNATAIIIAHNHPSGVAKPTEQDTELTKRLVLSGDILDITVLDHLIVTEEDYFRSPVLPACGSPICSAFIKPGSRATSWWLFL